MRFEITSRLKGYKLNAGVNAEYARYYNSTFQKIFANNQLITVDYQSEIDLLKWGAYAQMSRKAYYEKLTVSAGFRVDGNSYSKRMKNMFNQFSPRISVSYQLTPFFSMNANAGTYYQLPSYTVLGYRDDRSVLKNKENNLSYISVDQVIAGFEYQPRSNVQITIEGFYKQYQFYPFSVRDSISLANKGADFGVIGDEEVLSDGEGLAYGAELFVRLKLQDKLTAILSYTYVVSEFKDKTDNFIASSWDSRHLLTITASKAFKRNWNLGFKWRFAGGLPTTPYDMETSALRSAWDTQNRAFIDADRLNDLRLRAFHRLDIRIDKNYYFKRWSLMFYIDIQNVYNFTADQPDYIIRTQNEDGTYKTIVENGQEKYVLKSIPSGSGTVLPTIGIMIEF